MHPRPKRNLDGSSFVPLSCQPSSPGWKTGVQGHMPGGRKGATENKIIAKKVLKRSAASDTVQRWQKVASGKSKVNHEDWP